MLSVCVCNGKVNPCWVSHPSVPHGDLSSSQNVSQTNEVMLGARIRALCGHCAEEMMFPEKFHRRGAGEGWRGPKGSVQFRHGLGERLGHADWLQANKWTFYEAPLSEKQSEKSSGNGENNLVLMGPRWSLKSQVCKRQCWRTCYLKKNATDLVLKGKK